MGIRAKTVVCIEDEQEMIELVKLILGRQQIEVHGALGGREGLERIAEIKPDLVLLDLMMPEMDGWEVFQKMKASDDMREIPVIVVTAKAQSIDRVLGLHIARVDDYITKPFGPQELLDSVRRVLNERGSPAEDGGVELDKAEE
jgi:DNA-binding response OmpR family regulator